jgi:hypothetical protein
VRAGLWPGVLQGVGERLLDDPVDGKTRAGPPVAWCALASQGDLDASGADLVDEPIEVVQTWLRAQLVDVGPLGLARTR